MCIRITSKYWIRELKEGINVVSFYYRKTDIAQMLTGYGDSVYTADDLPHPSSPWNECAPVETIVINYTPIFNIKMNKQLN